MKEASHGPTCLGGGSGCPRRARERSRSHQPYGGFGELHPHSMQTGYSHPAAGVNDDLTWGAAMSRTIFAANDGPPGAFTALTAAIDAAVRYDVALHMIFVEEIPLFYPAR